MSPTFVDIFMAALEKKFMASLATRLREKIKFYKRYLDDILLIWDGSQTEFEEFFKLLNALCRNDSVTIWYGRFSEILTFCCMSQLQRQETHTRNENCCNEVALYPMDLP